MILLMVVGGFGRFWVVLDGFGWFHVLVTTAYRLETKKTSHYFSDLICEFSECHSV